MQLSAATKINDLLATHPFLQDFLVAYHPRFQLLKNGMARATVGRLATLGAAARIAGVEIDALLRDTAAAIEKETDRRPDLIAGGPKLTRADRIAMLGHIVAGLHDGGDLQTARQQFAAAVGDVDAGEIAAMEEEMIRGGLAVSEVQRLCDVHVGAFRGALDEKAPLTVPAGHPVHTYQADNAILLGIAKTLAETGRTLAQSADNQALAAVREALSRYDGLDNHYLRKEHQLFPLLERHSVTGPSQVMWALHDEIRSQWKKARVSAEAGDVAALANELPGLARAIVEMTYKEEKILLPLALEKLSADEWAEEKRGEDELGYRLAKPAVGLPLVHGRPLPTAGTTATSAPASNGLLDLATGALSLEIVDLLLRHLPVDISFVDEHDVVRYYSDGKERIFPRSPAAIGRQVQNCHPPKSVATVNKILDSFRAGTKDVAEFWIEMGGRFIHIRYFAVRDAAAAYRGCLEVSQDVTGIRALSGQRRLLDWEG